MNDCLAYKHKRNKYDLIVREEREETNIIMKIFCLLKYICVEIWGAKFI